MSQDVPVPEAGGGSASPPQGRPPPHRPALKRFAANVGWLLSERVLLMAVGFVVNVWFVRRFGPGDYGLYNYALSYAALFTALTSLGMDPVVVRELTRRPESEGAILGTALLVRIGAGTVTWAAAAGGVWLGSGQPLARGLVTVFAATGAFQALGVFELVFQARVRARGVVLARMAVNLAFHGIRLLLLSVKAPLMIFAVLSVANAGAIACAILLLYRSERAAETRLRWSPDLAKGLIRDSWPLVIVGFAITVYMRIDQVMLSSMLGTRENGLYASAAVLAELWHFIPAAVATSVLPLVVMARDQLPPAIFEQRMQSVYDGMAALSYGVALPVALLAGPIVRLVYGSAFAAAADILVVKVWAFVFISLGTARSGFLVAENLTRFNMLATLLGAATSVALNLLLIPRHGGAGAAWATLAAQMVSAYGSGFLDRRVQRQTLLMTRALLVPLRPGLLWRSLKAALIATR